MDVFPVFRSQRAASFAIFTCLCMLCSLVVILGCRNARPFGFAHAHPHSLHGAPHGFLSATRVAQQVEHGKRIYGKYCADCHGDAGQGNDMAPAVVGEGAFPLQPRRGSKRTVMFRTAMDIASFVTQAMPPDEEARAELRQQDYWAVLAFALKANGIELSEPVGPDNAAQIVLHP